MSSNYLIADLAQIAPVDCPCGQARRAFGAAENAPASVHVVEIHVDARTHYHKRLTETYVILEGQGHLELDGKQIPVRPMMAVMIKPGCRHRAVGTLRVINIVIPPFDPADEWFD
jgi:mannose-6-phosphate isomerase-like protein (cupin superfamily)